MPIDLSLTLEESYIAALIDQTLERHREILLARSYHEGIQPVYLTERQAAFLDLHSNNPFNLNVTRTVVITLRDELNIVGFDTGEKADEDGIKKQAKWFWDLWDKNNMDGRQGEIHEWALRDSEAFIILDWNRESKVVEIVQHERFTDINAEAWLERWDENTLNSRTMEAMRGTGAGVWMVYENDDPNQKAMVAIQQWKDETIIEGKIRDELRRTFYYPDRIERYYFDGAIWLEKQPPQKWVDQKGAPLGIPVIHFKNENLRPEAWDAIPPQDAINKTWIDILGTMDLAGFPMIFLLGMYPTIDGLPPAADNSNVWNVGPAQILGNANTKGGDASIDRIEGTDPTGLMNTLKDQIMFVAQITGTPSNRFTITAAIASEKTLKEQKDELRKRAYNRQILFGNAWGNMMIIARRINNAFGQVDDRLEEDVTVQPIWKNLQSVDELKEEKELGVPQEAIWLKMGFTQDQIQAMNQTLEAKITREKSIWDGYTAASSHGIELEVYLKRIGLSDKEIKEILAGMNTEEIPPTNL